MFSYYEPNGGLWLPQLQHRVRANDLLRRVLVACCSGRRQAPILDESFIQGVSGGVCSALLAIVRV